MSYGQNQPWGLQAVKTTSGATWNGQTSPYFIKSGYAYNIFKGDPVYLGADGYIHSLYEGGSQTNPPSGAAGSPGTYTQGQILGVFNGCSFVTNTSTNPIDPASPGRPYWPGGTVTLNAQDATADIIDDPAVIFNVQTGSTGALFSDCGGTAAVVFPTTSPSGASFTGTVYGNFNTGQSAVTVQVPASTSPLVNVRILRLVQVSGNISGLPYNNVEVLIQNHSFASRPVGL